MNKKVVNAWINCSAKEDDHVVICLLIGALLGFLGRYWMKELKCWECGGRLCGVPLREDKKSCTTITFC